MIMARKIEVLGENPLLVPLCLSHTHTHTHTPQGLSRHLSPSIQSVTGGKVNILGGLRIGHSKQKSVYVHVSYCERLTVHMQNC